MNYLKRKLIDAQRTPKEKIEMYNGSVYLPEGSLTTVFIDEYPTETSETERIRLSINYITQDPQPEKKMYYITVFKVQNNIVNTLIKDLTYLCSASIDNSNFMVFYKIIED